MLMSGGGAPPFDPVTSGMFAHLYWAEGPEFVALGLSNGNAVTTWPDEVGTADLGSGGGCTYASAFTDGVTGKGPFPAVDFNSGIAGPSSFTSIGPTHSVVLIVAPSNVSGSKYVIDGKDSSHRRLIRVVSSNWEQYAGTSAASATAATTGLHVFTSVIVSGTSDVLRLDGSNINTASAGDHAMTGLTLGGAYDATAGVFTPGKYLFAGVYDGDVRSSGSWTDFVAWVSTHYTLTV